jgi:hypothetical protein
MTEVTAIRRRFSAEHICERTGVALVKFPELGTWRVYRSKHEAVKGRAWGSPDPLYWSRFELHGRARTRYSATTRGGAFKDALAEFRYDAERLGELIRTSLDGITSRENPILDEWCKRGHMVPGGIPKRWHERRTVGRLAVKNVGWFVDVEHDTSMRSITRALRESLTNQGISALDVGILRSNTRKVTCAVAAWLESQFLDDGSVPLGIRYMTAYGGTQWESWAAFPETTIELVEQQGVDLNDPDLQETVDFWGLHLF